MSDAQGIRCTKIVTDTQITLLDFNYEATCYLNEFYSPEQPLLVGKMLGLWTRDLFEMRMPFSGSITARQQRSVPPPMCCARCVDELPMLNSNWITYPPLPTTVNKGKSSGCAHAVITTRLLGYRGYGLMVLCSTLSSLKFIV